MSDILECWKKTDIRDQKSAIRKYTFVAWWLCVRSGILAPVEYAALSYGIQRGKDEERMSRMDG
jgi:hypothetical protein